MIIRKAQKTGGKSYSIVLPKSWVFENNITSNPYIYVRSTFSGSLEISAQHSDDLVIKKTLSFDGDVSLLSQDIISHYVTGFDEIRIVAKSNVNALTHSLKTTLSHLIGYEVVERGKDYLLIKNVHDTTRYSTHEAILNMINLINQAIDSLDGAFKNADILDVHREIEGEVDKINFMLMRTFHAALINKNHGYTVRQIAEMYTHRNCAGQLERISDHIWDMVQIFYKHDLYYLLEKDVRVIKEINTSFIQIINQKASLSSSLNELIQRGYLKAEKRSQQYKKSTEYAIILHAMRIFGYHRNIFEALTNMYAINTTISEIQPHAQD